MPMKKKRGKQTKIRTTHITKRVRNEEFNKHVPSTPLYILTQLLFSSFRYNCLTAMHLDSLIFI